MRIFVSNIHFEADEKALRDFFFEAGYLVQSVTVQTKEDERGKRRFAFVEIRDAELSAQAIAELDGQELMGRRLNIQEARPIAPKERARAARQSG